jgi:hypothetical protein
VRKTFTALIADLSLEWQQYYAEVLLLTPKAWLIDYASNPAVPLSYTPIIIESNSMELGEEEAGFKTLKIDYSLANDTAPIRSIS